MLNHAPPCSLGPGCPGRDPCRMGASHLQNSHLPPHLSTNGAEIGHVSRELRDIFCRVVSQNSTTLPLTLTLTHTNRQHTQHMHKSPTSLKKKKEKSKSNFSRALFFPMCSFSGTKPKLTAILLPLSCNIWG